MDNRCTFKKTERISFQREIDLLFNNGKNFISYPLRFLFLKHKPISGEAVSVLISVPKKKIKLAVNRNRIKRMIRETYRLNKNSLTGEMKNGENGLLIAFIYIGNEFCKLKEIEVAMLKAFSILKEKIE